VITDSHNRNNSFFQVRFEIWICLFLVFATFGVYRQIRTHDFVNFDDAEYVYAYIEPIKDRKLFYKITKEDYDINPEELEPLVNIPDITVI